MAIVRMFAVDMARALVEQHSNSARIYVAQQIKGDDWQGVKAWREVASEVDKVVRQLPLPI